MAKTSKDKDFRESKLKTLWFFLKPYKLHVVALFILASVIGVLETATVAAIYPVVSVGLDIESGQDNVLLSLISRIAAISPLKDAFVSYCILIILLAIVVFIIKAINVYLLAHFSTNIAREAKERIFRKQLKADYQHFLDEKQGGLVYVTTQATGAVWHLITSVTRMLSEIILMLSIFVLLFSMNWKGSMLVVLVGVGYYFLTQHIGNKVSYAAGAGIAKAATSEHVVLNEVFTGIKQIKASLTESRWVNGFETAVRQEFTHFKRNRIWTEIPSHSLWLLLFSALAIVAAILWTKSAAGFTALIPLFGTFAFAMLRLLGPVSNFGTLRMQIMTAFPNAELTYAALNKQFDTIKDGRKELRLFTHNIELDHVSFTHKGRKKTIKDVSVTLEKGKTTAIVGPSGAGKTTIVDLLLRLFDPDKGEIRIDGVNLKEYKLSSWLSRIGLVTQDTFVFHDSVKNNITFGLDGYSEEQIAQAAKGANAHDFILEFPQRYDTIVGERGMKLSGGQKQRIAIARAIIKKPDILILDEATSALDNISEELVQEAINKISKERTVIVVAHRLSTIINADKIVVLENGRAMEEGTHRELMKRRGVYWKLYKSQENM
jgi:ABC-type multidrug transport system fused ATPase/permease subunit